MHCRAAFLQEKMFWVKDIPLFIFNCRGNKGHFENKTPRLVLLPSLRHRPRSSAAVFGDCFLGTGPHLSRQTRKCAARLRMPHSGHESFGSNSQQSPREAPVQMRGSVCPSQVPDRLFRTPLPFPCSSEPLNPAALL